MNERDKKLIEENWDRLEITMKSLISKFNIPEQDIEDYCQTGYLVLCSKAYKYDGRTRFTTFANTVITNAFIDKYRSEKSKKTSSLSLDEIYDEDDSAYGLTQFLAGENTAENSALSKITSDMIEQHIKKVKNSSASKTQRRNFEALELKIQGYSSEEIAKIFNMPANSLRTMTSRARKILLSDSDFVKLLNS